MKIDNTDSVDLFPTAEEIFRENTDTIFLLENRRRSLIIVFVLVAAVIAAFCVIAIPFAFDLLMEVSGTSSAADNRLTGNVIFTIACAIAFIFFEYEFLDDIYRSISKRKLMAVIAGRLNMKYRRSGFFYLTEIYDHHILPPYRTRKVEEGFSGKYKGFRIEFQDFFINPVRRIFDGQGITSIMTGHHHYGLAMRIKLNKSFKHHTVLLPARDLNRILGNLPNANLFLHEDVDLVYNDFHRHFICLSTSQIESRYVLDPAVIERFTILAETFDTDRISASFMDDEMVVLMRPVINLFEVGSLRDPVTVLTIERSLQQIKALCDMVEIFELSPFAGLGARVKDGMSNLG